MIAKYVSAVNMIPLFKTREPEAAVNLLLGHFRHVLINILDIGSYRWRIRFRADLITDYEVYFDRMGLETQVKLWRERGGALLHGQKLASDAEPGPHDAQLLNVCPRMIRLVQDELRDTATVGVIREPVHWRAQEERVVKNGTIRALRDFDQLKTLVALLPVFSRESLKNLPPSPILSQLSSSRVSHVNVVRSPDNSC